MRAVRGRLPRRAARRAPASTATRLVKFGALLGRARHLYGCEAVATGHYARVEAVADASATRRPALPAAGRASTRDKDQSYFLYGLRPGAAGPHALPARRADASRRCARWRARHGLVTADKPESQEICFVPERRLPRGAARRGRLAAARRARSSTPTAPSWASTPAPPPTPSASAAAWAWRSASASTWPPSTWPPTSSRWAAARTSSAARCRSTETSFVDARPAGSLPGTPAHPSSRRARRRRWSRRGGCGRRSLARGARASRPGHRHQGRRRSSTTADEATAVIGGGRIASTPPASGSADVAAAWMAGLATFVLRAGLRALAPRRRLPHLRLRLRAWQAGLAPAARARRGHPRCAGRPGHRRAHRRRPAASATTPCCGHPPCRGWASASPSSPAGWSRAGPIRRSRAAASVPARAEAGRHARLTWPGGLTFGSRALSVPRCPGAARAG